MRVGAVALVVFAIGCQGPKGDTGLPGLTGPPGKDAPGAVIPDGGVAPQVITCSPGENFCLGTRVATCTLSGADGVLSADCSTDGTTTNPSSCVTTGCAGGAKACCRKQKPICKWNWSEPFSSAGEKYLFDASDYCSLGVACPQDPTFSVSWVENISVCPGATRQVSISFDKSKVAVGATVMLPMAGVNIILVDTEAGQPQVSCSSWTGNFRFDSDVPAWSVFVSATCSEANKTTLQVSGTLSGSL